VLGFKPGVSAVEVQQGTVEDVVETSCYGLRTISGNMPSLAVVRGRGRSSVQSQHTATSVAWPGTGGEAEGRVWERGRRR